MANNPLQTGLEKVKGVLGGLIEPALIFAATGSKTAAIWGGLKAVLLAKVLGPLSLISGAMVGFVGVIKLAIGKSELLARGMQKLRELETLKTQFQPLLGGAASAQKRLDELYHFAASTPFQLTEIAEASKTLEVLSKGAISTGESLRMVGDAAAVSGQSMQTVAFWTGRLYDGLKSGRPIGEAAGRLQEMGLINGTVRQKLIDSVKAGDEFNKTWDVFEKGMGKTKGGMEELSQTLGGLESTLADVRAGFKAGFADNFMEAEKEGVRTSITLLEAFAEPIARIGAWISKLANLFSYFINQVLTLGGNIKNLSGVMSYLVDAMVALGGAIAGLQIATAIAGIVKMGQASGVATMFSKANALAVTWQGNAHLGLAARLQLCGAQWMAYTTKEKIAAIGGLFAGGVFKGLALIFGMLRGAILAATAAIANNPFGAIALAISFLVVGLWRLFDNLQAQAEAAQKVRDSYKEMIDKMREAANVIATFSDKIEHLEKLNSKIEEAKKELEEMLAIKADQNIFNFGMGEDNTETIIAQRAAIAELLSEKEKILQIEESSLRLGKEKLKQIEDEVSLQKKLLDIAHEGMGMGASDAEKAYLMQKKIAELDASTQRGMGTKQDIVDREKEKRQLSDTQGIELGEAKEASELLKTQADHAQAEFENLKNTYAEGDQGLVASLSDGRFGDALYAGVTSASRLLADGIVGVGGKMTGITEDMRSQVAFYYKELYGSVEAGEKALGALSSVDATSGDQTFLYGLRAEVTKRRSDAAAKVVADMEKAHELQSKYASGEMAISPEVLAKVTSIGSSYRGEDLFSGKDGKEFTIKATQEMVDMGKAKKVDDDVNARDLLGVGGQITALRSKLSDEALEGHEHARTKAAIEAVIKALENEADQASSTAAEVARLKEERDKLNRSIRLSIALLEAEQGRHEAMLALTRETWQNKKKALEAELAMREKVAAAIQKDGEEAKSIKDLEGEVAFLEGKEGGKREYYRAATQDDVKNKKATEVGESIRGMETREEFGTRITGITGSGEQFDIQREVALAKQLENAKKSLQLAKDSAKEQAKAQRDIENAKKALDDFKFDKAEKLRDILSDAAMEALKIKIDVNIDDARFDQAFDNIKKLSDLEDKEWEHRRRRELLLAGVVEEAEANKIIAREKANREAQENLTRQLTRSEIGTGTLDNAAAMGGEENQFAGIENPGDFQKARLRMFGKVFGDSRAKEELETIENREFYKDKLAQLGKEGFEGPEAVKLANTALDTKLMGEVGERKTTVDSFRRIGAGGRAAVTDPMKQMAEKRNRILAAIEKDQKQLIKVMGGLPEKMPEAKVR